MNLPRCSGILLHPTSLPGRFGIGDLGPAAHTWIDTLGGTGCRVWQVLPLGPTGYGNSPYQCFSAFAGNPYLVSPDPLVEDGLLTEGDLADRPAFPPERVDFGPVIAWKLVMLDRAFEHIRRGSFPELATTLAGFRARQAGWLEDFALFMALKDLYGGRPWVDWPVPLRDRRPDQLAKARQLYETQISRHVFRQFLFFRQWQSVRDRAHAASITIVGDIPIFVAHDSADTWVNRSLFFLDDQGRPTVVAGVPPDYFSATGQLWGNPLYRWDVHTRSGYAWWLDRFAATFNLVDLVRLDHFRGFAGYYQIPAGAPTAEHGRWMDAPGEDFLEAIRHRFGELPIIAEDLGVITPDVVALRDRFALPGMKILQFGFGADETNDALPHRYPDNCVVYTGTHDNDTVRGWYASASEGERENARAYLGVDGSDIAWDLIQAAWASRARLAVAPLQDILDLGTEARMNYPGTPAGNWGWRMQEGAFTHELQQKVWKLNQATGRASAPSAVGPRQRAAS